MVKKVTLTFGEDNTREVNINPREGTQCKKVLLGFRRYIRAMCGSRWGTVGSDQG